ncbi:MAG: hypothetical protein ABIF89_00755 [bacterium]
MPKNNKGIISLIVLFGVGLFALATSLTISLGSLMELAKNRNNFLGTRSSYAAETAATEGFYAYQSDTNYPGGNSAENTSPLINETESSSIEVIPLTWPEVEIKGMADNKISHRETVYTINVFPEGMAFNYAAYAQNSLNIGGSVLIDGSIFANNEIVINGSSAQVTEDVFSATNVDSGNGNIGGEIFSNVTPLPAPQINIEDYRDAATQYFEDIAEAKTYTNGLNGTEIIFIEPPEGTGNIIIHVNKLEGSLIVKGGPETTLVLNGGEYAATDNYAAIVVEGNLRLAGNVEINGVVYVSGSTSFGGGDNVINGSLVSVGGASVIDFTGHTTINYDPSIAETWANLTGLEPTSTQSPRIIRWREE